MSDDRKRKLSFSSEHPYERWFGTEILDHNPKSIRMDFMKSGKAPLLMGHDMRLVIGIIEKASIDTKDKMGRADVRFSKSAFASEKLADVDDGILVNVSTGYRVHEMVLEKQSDHGDTYRVTDWEPLEASLVGIPADPTVGVGRSAEVASPEISEVRSVIPAAAAAIPKESKVDNVDTAAAASKADVKIDVGAETPNALQIEKLRVQAIRNLAKINKIDERTEQYWIANGIDANGVSEDLLRIIEERGKTNPQSAASLGMQKNDVAQFSLARAIAACAGNDWKLAPFELDCSRQIASKLNKPVDTQRFFVPFEVLQREAPARSIQRRDLTTQIPGDGGYLVQTENQGFVDILRNRSVAFRLGARRLSGLNGNVTIPKQTGAGTAYWLATESSSPTESQQAFQQIALTPKTASAYTEISRNLLLQSSPGAEGIVSDDLAQITAIAVDLAALSGSGAAGQPTGIVNTSGIGSVTATSVDYAKVLEFQTDVATANVTPVRGGYVTTPAAAAILMAKQRFSSTDTPLWQGNVWDGTVVGFPAMSSNQLSAGMIFGDWSELVIGEWGVLEIAVNPYANFQAGIIGVRAMYSVDVGVRRAFAFSYASSVTA